MKRTRLIALLLPLLLAVGAGPASALSVVTCLVLTNAVAFGFYDPTAAAGQTAAGNVNVTCALVGSNTTVAYTIALSKGSGSFAQRTMKFGSIPLNYNLYTSSGYGTIWGDGTSSTSMVSDSMSIDGLGTINNYPVYAMMPGSQVLTTGLYSDSITVTVTY